MESVLQDIMQLQKTFSNTYWGDRITAQLAYGHRVSIFAENKHNDLLESAVSILKQVDSISEDLCKQCEQILMPMSKDCKKYSLHCASHSHIDLNFLWGFDETVSVILNTFSTMLTLLKEYPTFIYSQSSAAAYEIVEKYAPEMIGEIKKFIHEGRWELTASSWVEADKNMPTTESHIRQIFYAKKYLAKLFDISLDSLKLAFEPDTFGHSKNMPEILQSAGVDYYYFCRGHNNSNNIFIWESDSKKQVIAYKEPHWYDSRIQSDIVMTVPEFCHTNKVDTMMKVYGVGDHGGGPTRRDIERVLDMATWSIFPTIYFGSYHSYFEIIERSRDKFPVVHNELNPIFTGCYTSQSKIKAANKTAEAMLFQAELYNTFSVKYANDTYRTSLIDEGWKNTLFNQFHDILPGSCYVEVKEHAMGKFQETIAAANTVRTRSLEAIAKEINTSCYKTICKDDPKSFCMGAGAGVFVGSMYKTGMTEKSTGQNRLFHVFNNTQYNNKEVVQVLLWDYDDEVDTIAIYDENNNPVTHQIIKKDFNEHWGHFYIELYVECEVPAFGYCTYLLTQKHEYELEDIGKMALDYKLVLENIPPNEEHKSIVLENSKIKATFHTNDFSIISLVDKLTGFEHCKQPMGIFRHILEDTESGGNAWVIGRYMKATDISKFSLVCCITEGLHQYITIKGRFENSRIEVTISLDNDDNKLVYKVNCEFLENGNEESVPQLNFIVNQSYNTNNYIYDIPAGTIIRGDSSTDCCANSFVVADGNNSRLMITSNSKYGYRCENNSMSITLLRASRSPDKYPEIGKHIFSFAVCVVDDKISSAYKTAKSLLMPMIPVSTAVSKGSLPLKSSFLSVDCDDVVICSVKTNEQGAMLIRLLEVAGKSSTITVKLPNHIASAVYVDSLEQPIQNKLKIKENTIILQVKANNIYTILIDG